MRGEFAEGIREMERKAMDLLKNFGSEKIFHDLAVA
jgi:hypothetical protein